MINEITIYECKCERCGFTWRPMKGIPELCAKCKSKHWNATDRTETSKARVTKESKRKRVQSEAQSKEMALDGGPKISKAEIVPAAVLDDVLPAVGNDADSLLAVGNNTEYEVLPIDDEGLLPENLLAVGNGNLPSVGNSDSDDFQETELVLDPETVDIPLTKRKYDYAE